MAANILQALCASLLLSLTHSGFLSGSLWLSPLCLSLSLSGSVLLILVHSDSLWLTLALSLALSGAHRLTRSLLGSPRYGCVATVYPTLLLKLPSHQRSTYLYNILTFSFIWLTRGLCLKPSRPSVSYLPL